MFSYRAEGDCSSVTPCEDVVNVPHSHNRIGDQFRVLLLGFKGATEKISFFGGVDFAVRSLIHVFDGETDNRMGPCIPHHEGIFRYELVQPGYLPNLVVSVNLGRPRACVWCPNSQWKHIGF